MGSMKLNGISVKIEREVVIPILSDNSDPFYLIGRPIMSYDEFELVCPAPKPMVGGEPGKEKPLPEHKLYKEAMVKRAVKFNDWVNLKTLVEVANAKGERFPIEWETVDMNNPDTYANWKKELKEINGLSDGDIQRIEMDVLRCNSMDSELIEKAKDDFLAIKREVQVV